MRDNQLLLNKRTALEIENFLAKPSHTLLITGPVGAGKFALAINIATKLLATSTLDTYPYFYHLKRAPGKKDISIDSVRELIGNLRLRTPGSNSIRRVAIVEDAQYLSLQAQNSLLKTLEEAPTDTVIILTSPSEYELLPTIVSRAQKLSVHPVSLKATGEYFQLDEVVVRPNWLLSKGSAGLLNALMAETDQHPLKTAVQEFKLFLSYDSYERFALVDKLEKNKQELGLFLEAGLRILAILHKDAVAKDNNSQAKRLLLARKKIILSKRYLDAGASPRLVVMYLIAGLRI